MEERLQKYMASCGVASRRKCEEIICQGKVKVNGTVVSELGIKVNPLTDIVEYEGKVIKKEENTIITKGDNNKSIDTYEVLNYQILGKGTNWSIPYIGYYADFIYNHKYLLVIAAGLIFMDILYDNKREKMKNEEVN